MFHYPSSLSIEEMAAKHIELFDRTDMDNIKVMQDSLQSKVDSQGMNGQNWRDLQILKCLGNRLPFKGLN